LERRIAGSRCPLSECWTGAHDPDDRICFGEFAR
jgi:hypothetical protein